MPRSASSPAAAPLPHGRARRHAPKIVDHILQDLQELLRTHRRLIIEDRPSSARRLGGPHALPHHLHLALGGLVRTGTVRLRRVRRGDYRQACSAHDWQADLLYLHLKADPAPERGAEWVRLEGLRPEAGAPTGGVAAWAARHEAALQAQGAQARAQGYPQSPRRAGFPELMAVMGGAPSGHRSWLAQRHPRMVQLGDAGDWDPAEWAWVRAQRPAVQLWLPSGVHLNVQARPARLPGAFRISPEERAALGAAVDAERDAEWRAPVLRGVLIARPD